jgi:hypothetical protein
MFKIKVKWLWMFLVATALGYPISVLAASGVTEGNDFVAPFLFSWLGVWVFAAAGGLCAGFVRITDIDERLNRPILAKFVIGLFWGVALCSLIDAFTSTPQAALTFFALFASCFSAPICAGLMVYLSNQKRLNSAFDQVARKRTGIDLTNISKQEYNRDKEVKKDESD